MSLPAYDPTKHDVSIDGVGWMMSGAASDAAPVALMRLDAEPAIARSAVGEGVNENFTLSSFFFQTDLEGGVGQYRLAAADRALAAVAETRTQGHIFPPKGVLTTGSLGGGTQGYFRIDATLYGINGANSENIASGALFGGWSAPAAGQRVKVPGTGAALAVTSANQLLRQRGAAAAINITGNLPDEVTPRLVELYSRWLWCLGSITKPLSPNIRQQGTATNTKDTGTLATQTRVRLAKAPLSSSVMLAIFMRSSAGGVPEKPVGWTTLVDDNAQIVIWGKAAATHNDQELIVTHTAGTAAAREVLWLFEMSGLDQDDPFMSGIDTATPSGTTHTISGASSTTGLTLAVILAVDTTATFNATTNYIALGGANTVVPGGTPALRYGLRWRSSSADTSVSITSSAAVATFMALVKLRASSVTSSGVPREGHAAIQQTALLVSDDDGDTWTLLDNVSAGMPTPISTLAVQGSMFVTTDVGLYEIKVEETVTSATSAPLAAIRGPLDSFQYPLDTAHIGTWMCAFDGSVYYNLGASIRRFPPGGRAEQIWPPRGWATGGGSVISMTAGEGGVYFGTSAGYLFCYDGRGFHQIAKATAAQLAQLYWFGGKLYLAGAPAPYFNYGYPSLRPDISHPSNATYTTGAVVTSVINMDKVGDPKLVRRFETHAEFTNGATTALQSGTLELQYLNADAGIHPEILDPLSNAPPWVSVGTHSVADGNVKTYTLPTPIRFTRLFLRVILTPGSLGIPICEGYGIDGETLMQRRVRLVLQLALSTSTLDRTGGRMYPTQAAVAAAVSKLLSFRDPAHASYTPHFLVTYRETGGSVASHRCLAEKLDDWLESHQGANGLFTHSGASLVLRELP